MVFWLIAYPSMIRGDWPAGRGRQLEV